MKTHERMIAKWKKDTAFKAEYDALEQEFAMFDELLKARLAAQLTQAEVAKRMGTKVPAISRMESSSGGRKHSPSITTLQKYAAAVGCRLVVKLEPAVRARKRGQAHFLGRK